MRVRDRAMRRVRPSHSSAGAATLLRTRWAQVHEVAIATASAGSYRRLARCRAA